MTETDLRPKSTGPLTWVHQVGTLSNADFYSTREFSFHHDETPVSKVIAARNIPSVDSDHFQEPEEDESRSELAFWARGYSRLPSTLVVTKDCLWELAPGNKTGFTAEDWRVQGLMNQSMVTGWCIERHWEQTRSSSRCNSLSLKM